MFSACMYSAHENIHVCIMYLCVCIHILPSHAQDFKAQSSIGPCRSSSHPLVPVGPAVIHWSLLHVICMAAILLSVDGKLLVVRVWKGM